MNYTLDLKVSIETNNNLIHEEAQDLIDDLVEEMACVLEDFPLVKDFTIISYNWDKE